MSQADCSWDVETDLLVVGAGAARHDDIAGGGP
ncbi:hypothetical protein ACVWYI_007023 [Bradyrhizobium sp. LB13.1]